MSIGDRFVADLAKYRRSHAGGTCRSCERRGCLSTNRGSSNLCRSRALMAKNGPVLLRNGNPWHHHTLCAQSRSVSRTQRTPYREIELRGPCKFAIIQMRKCLYPEDSGVDYMVILVHVLDELQLNVARPHNQNFVGCVESAQLGESTPKAPGQRVT